MPSAQRIALNSLPAGTILISGTYRPAVGATAYVYQHGTTTPVPVYAAETGPATLSQPLAADPNGQLPGWVAGGQDLDIVATLGGSSASEQAEPVIASAGGGGGGGLPSSDDLSAIAATNPTAADVSMNAHKLTALADATAGTDALNRETGDTRYVHQDGTGLPASVETDLAAGGPKPIDSTGVADGQALIYDVASGHWKPGSAGAAVSDPVGTRKDNFAILGFTPNVGSWIRVSAAVLGSAAWMSALQTGANGNKATWQVALGAGTWALDLAYWQESDNGKADLTIDGGAVVSSIDGYNATGQSVATTINLGALSAGNHAVALTINGKNVSSSGFFFMVHLFSFRRTA